MSITFIIIVVLILGVVFVNGWTDAPNAIATVVSTRCMTPRAAVIMAAIFNFIGVLVTTLTGAKVANTIQEMVTFETNVPGQENYPLVALAAAMFAIVVWAVAAWYFSIPTSESHALIAGVSGGAIALSGLGALNAGPWLLIGYGLIISSVIGGIAGFITVKLVELIFKRVRRRSANKFFKGAEIFSGASMAFLHGAQDGQKFIGIFLLGLILQNSGTEYVLSYGQTMIVVVICSVVMGVGTSIGGYKIIKAVGMDMVKLEVYQGFSADLSAAVCLFIATFTGIPLSTTHSKTMSIVGVGAAKRLNNVDWGVVKEMVWAWVLTFPGCMLIGYLMAKLFLLIF